MGNIGLIYSANGELDPAARQCFTEALRILGQHGLWRGRESMRRATALPLCWPNNLIHSVAHRFGRISHLGYLGRLAQT